MLCFYSRQKKKKTKIDNVVPTDFHLHPFVQSSHIYISLVERDAGKLFSFVFNLYRRSRQRRIGLTLSWVLHKPRPIVFATRNKGGIAQMLMLSALINQYLHSHLVFKLKKFFVSPSLWVAPQWTVSNYSDSVY